MSGVSVLAQTYRLRFTARYGTGTPGVWQIGNFALSINNLRQTALPSRALFSYPPAGLN